MKNIEGIADITGKKVVINRRGEGYRTRNLVRLAGTLAHEAEHMRRRDFDERAAYRRQYDALSQLRGLSRTDAKYIEGVRKRCK